MALPGSKMLQSEVRRGPTALIADDDEFFRAALSASLTGPLGYAHVIQAGSFDEAVELLDSSIATHRVSLALFDLSMPGISNPWNLRSIREVMPDTTLVVVSASESRNDILRSLDAGVHGYVPKGLGIRELERALQFVLAGNIYVPRNISRIDDSPLAVSGGQARQAAPAAQLPELTPRQRQVLEMIVNGKSNKEIARALQLGEGTVKMHMTALLRNLNVSNRTAAAAAAAPFFRPST